MTPDTPLTEVAQLLPSAAAALLLEASSDVQIKTLETVRSCFLYWESRGITLDPVQLEGFMGALVAAVAAMAVRLEEQAALIAFQDSALRLVTGLGSK